MNYASRSRHASRFGDASVMGRKRIQQPAHAERDGNRFAFYDLPLSIPSRRQLAAIDRSVGQHQNAAASRCVLLNDFILKHAFDIDMGCYMPVGHRVDIPGKLPLVSETLTGTRMGFPVQPSKNQFFGNALVTPPLYGTAKFDTNNVPPPKFRATNIGFIVVTLEMDCTTPGQ